MRKFTLIAYCIVAVLMAIVFINNLDPWRPETDASEPIQLEQQNVQDGSCISIVPEKKPEEKSEEQPKEKTQEKAK